MATKKITELTLRSAFSETCNVPIDDTVQSYRVTGDQISDFVLNRIPTGIVAPFVGTTAPTGWLLVDGKTLGSGTSGATGRANADAAALYAIIWNATSNTDIVIQDSSGSATTRGANAAADFAADKRLPLPDFRGEFLRGLDNSRGIDPARAMLSAQAANMAVHTHPAGTYAADNAATTHNHTAPTLKFSQSGAPGSARWVWDTPSPQGVPIGPNDAPHTHTVSGSAGPTGTGSDTRGRNVSVNHIIKL